MAFTWGAILFGNKTKILSSSDVITSRNGTDLINQAVTSASSPTFAGVNANVFSGDTYSGYWQTFSSSGTADDGSETFTTTSSNWTLAALGTGGSSGSGGNTENYLGFARGASWVTDISLGSNVLSFSSDPGLAGVTDGKIGICFVDATTIKIYNRRGATRSFTLHVWGR